MLTIFFKTPLRFIGPLLCVTGLALLPTISLAKASLNPPNQSSLNVVGQTFPDGVILLSDYPILRNSQISSNFGVRKNPFSRHYENHDGLDIIAQSGSPIVAAGSGRVTFSGYAPGYGYLVEIDHGNGVITRYGHASSLLVDSGDWVQSNQAIATVGVSGRSTGPHLHFELSVNRVLVDPRQLLYVEGRPLSSAAYASISKARARAAQAPDKFRAQLKRPIPASALYTSKASVLYASKANIRSKKTVYTQ